MGISDLSASTAFQNDRTFSSFLKKSLPVPVYPMSLIQKIMTRLTGTECTSKQESSFLDEYICRSASFLETS
eukprot:UN14789